MDQDSLLEMASEAGLPAPATVALVDVRNPQKFVASWHLDDSRDLVVCVTEDYATVRGSSARGQHFFSLPIAFEDLPKELASAVKSLQSMTAGDR